MTTLRNTIGLLAAAALLGGTMAAAPVTTAQAVPALSVSISGLVPTYTAPKVATTLNFTVTIDGPDPSTGYYGFYSCVDYSGPTAALQASNGATSVVRPYAYAPDISFTDRKPGAYTYTLSLSPYTTPGRYQLSVPVCFRPDDGVAQTATATALFVVSANPVLTASYYSSFYMSGTFSKKSAWKVYYTGPEYVRGATVQIWYLASGKKKYVNIGSHKLNASGDASFKLKKGKVTKKGKGYFVITAVPFSAAAKSKVFTVKKI